MFGGETRMAVPFSLEPGGTSATAARTVVPGGGTGASSAGTR